MKISYNWLKEFLPDLTISPEEAAEILTMHSFETEVAGQFAVPPGVVVVKITKIEPHPNADRLRLATITDGQREIIIVCGADNIAVGQVVPYSPPGTRLKDKNNNKFTVKEVTIRGEKSPGTINSLRELGLHPKEHGGIWILPDDTPLGTQLADHVPVDTVLDADITPNRAHDCLSHRGIARELSALLKLEILEPSLTDLPSPRKTIDGFSITIEDTAKTPRYLGAILQEVSVRPSPLWLQARLLAAGGKPLNNLVDITNYVTFELGNPAHAFDTDRLPGKTIGTRLAKAGERLVMLDETEQELTEQDIVITSDNKPVAIAGVMGGIDSSISSTTRNIFLEVASFNAFSVQETSRRLSLLTEASVRFSKNLDINLVTDAARRAVGLLQEHAGASLTGVIDSHPAVRPPRLFEFRPHHVNKMAGSDIATAEQSRQILTDLRFIVDDKKEPWQVTAPTDRLDISGEHDLVEEVIRVIGLTNIISSPTAANVAARPIPDRIYWIEVVRDTLVQLGLTETFNYSFEPKQYTALANLAGKEFLSLINPVSPDMSNLRLSLLPGLLKNLATNRDAFHRHAGRKESSLFEIGHVYKSGVGNRIPGVDENLHLAAVIVGSTPSLSDTGSIIAQTLGLDSLSLTDVVTPEITSALKYHLPVHGFEINLDELLRQVDRPSPVAIYSLADLQSEEASLTQFTPLPKYPAIYRDLSILVDQNIAIEQVQEIIERAGGQLVVDVDLFDEYQPSDETKKSLAFHLTYQSPDKTLTDAEIGQIHNKIVAALQAELDTQLR
ncbi:MAG: phenylalanine--tRNA ligase subunit beta [bacterium]